MEFTTENLIYSISGIVVGIIINRLWDKWQRRLVRLDYYITKRLLGTSRDDKFGQVLNISFQGSPIDNLYVGTITVHNNSRSDFKDINLEIWCDVDSIMLEDRGNHSASFHALCYTQDYLDQERAFYEIKHDALSRDDAQLKQKASIAFSALMSRRKFDVPVLNRGEKVEFTCLVTSLKDTEPFISIMCMEKGIKLRRRFEPPNKLWGESGHWCAVVGLVIGTLVLILSANYIQSRAAIVTLAFLLGTCAAVPGFVVIKIWKKMQQMFQ